MKYAAYAFMVVGLCAIAAYLVVNGHYLAATVPSVIALFTEFKTVKS